MSTEKNSGPISLASYLSPRDIQNAVRLTKKLKSAKRIEEVLQYQRKLAVLMEKAEKNKRDREKVVRQHALRLKEWDKEQIKQRYAMVGRSTVGVDSKTITADATKNAKSLTEENLKLQSAIRKGE